MVSLLVQREQREAAERKARLLAARRAASALSVQQARTYKDRKRQQRADIREGARQLWLSEQQQQLQQVEALVARGAEHQGEGYTTAADHEAAGQREACAEAAAWQAEHQLEAARHRLAVAYGRAEQHSQRAPQLAAQRRRDSVRSVEKQRAARVVAAAPAALPLAAVLGSLQAHPTSNEEPTAAIPVARSGHRADSNDGASASPPVRLWRMSTAAPHSKVTVHDKAAGAGGADAAAESDEEGGGVYPVQRDTHVYAQAWLAAQSEREQRVAEGLERASQRATAAVERQHAERARAEAERRAQRERLAAVREAYRSPHGGPLRETSEGEAAVPEPPPLAPRSAAQKSSPPSRGDRPSPPSATPPQHHREPQPGETVPSPQQPKPQPAERRQLQQETHAAQQEQEQPVQPTPQRQQHPQQPRRLSVSPPARQLQAQKAYREGEDDFRSVFVTGPPVLMQLPAAEPRQAPLHDLLRPAHIADLLYDVAHSDPTRVEEEEAAEGTESGARPPAARAAVQTRVLPSAPLHMTPLPLHGGLRGTGQTLVDGVTRQQRELAAVRSAESPAQPAGASPLSMQAPQSSVSRVAHTDTAGPVADRRSSASPSALEREVYGERGGSPLLLHAQAGPPVAEAPDSFHHQPQQQQRPPAEEIAMSPLAAHSEARPALGEQRAGPGAAAVQHEQERTVQQRTPIREGGTNTGGHAVGPGGADHQEEAGAEPVHSAVVSAATTPLRSPPSHNDNHHAGGSPLLSPPAASSFTSSSESSAVTGDSSHTSSSGGSSVLESSGFSSSTASSALRQPLPTMTAEQLKLALMRLRSRISAPQM